MLNSRGDINARLKRRSDTLRCEEGIDAREPGKAYECRRSRVGKPSPAIEAQASDVLLLNADGVAKGLLRDEPRQELVQHDPKCPVLLRTKDGPSPSFLLCHELLIHV